MRSAEIFNDLHRDVRAMFVAGIVDEPFYLKTAATCALELLRRGASSDALYMVGKLHSRYLTDDVPAQAAEDPIFAAGFIELAELLLAKGYAEDASMFVSTTAPQGRPS